MKAHHFLIFTVLTCLLAPRALANDFAYDPTNDFIAFNPQYRQLKRQHRQRYELLKRRMSDVERTGRQTNCSKQVLDEAKWLLHYTTRFNELAARLDALETILNSPKDPHEKSQDRKDGSYGCCSQQWFFKLIKTDDEVLVRELTFRGIKHPLTMLDRINDPKRIIQHLESLLTSDVSKTGVDHRYELNLTASILTRMIAWEIPSNYNWKPKVADALYEFQDDTWQDPQTGFWGAWYRTRDGKLVKTSDLSMTFHFIHYREGDVGRWPQILKTTLAMNDLEYPNGWLEDGKLSNHHNYDVVAILKYGWKHLTDEQKQFASVEIQRMLDFCLKETLNEDGSFKLLADESTYAGAQLFGVSFLTECGYFNRPFWTNRVFPESAAIRKKIMEKLGAAESTDPEMVLARIMLAASAFGLN